MNTEIKIGDVVTWHEDINTSYMAPPVVMTGVVVSVQETTIVVNNGNLEECELQKSWVLEVNPEFDGEKEDVEEEAKFYCVAAYLYDREYGGSEEGGWWYSTFEPVAELGHLTKCFKLKMDAMNYRDALQSELDDMNKGRRSPNSVLSEGHYKAIWTVDEYPHYMPKERPHYE
jgi:hypothetical protein